MTRAYDPAAHKRRQYLRDTGRPSLVDGAWAISKVNSLHARGMSYKAMARQSGLDGTHHYSSLVERRPEKVFRATLERIKRLRFEPPEPGERGARLWPAGTRRRLQALVADGFSTTYLAAEIRKRHGVGSERGLYRIMVYSGIEHVHYNLAAAVADLYEQLDGADAVDCGVSERIVKYARTIGGKRRYPPRMCWDPDTIDDPNARPEWTGLCGSPTGYRIHRRDRIPMYGCGCEAAMSVHRRESRARNKKT